VDRNQDPIQDVDVALAGASNFSEETNAAGCANFSFIPAGNYTATISDIPRLVGWNGEDTLTKAVTSTAGQTTTYGPYEMDQPGDIVASFDTKVGSAAAVPAKSRYLSYNNAKLTVQWPVIDSGSNNTTSISALGLYPFLDGYGIYAGRCTTNKPAAVQNTPLDPNGTATPAVRLPSINIRVVNSTSLTAPGPVGVSNYTIVVKHNDGCTSTYTNQTSNPVTYGATTDQGAIPEPGYPYGTYTVCAQRTTGSPAVTRRGFADLPPYSSSPSTVNESVPNTNAAGNTTAWNTTGGLIRIYVPASGSTQVGSCP
jgi:hypothetical protein